MRLGHNACGRVNALATSRGQQFRASETGTPPLLAARRTCTAQALGLHERHRVPHKRVPPCRHSLNPAVPSETAQSTSGSDAGSRLEPHHRNNVLNGTGKDATTSSSFCCGAEEGTSVHVHHDKQAHWGPLRSGIYSLLQGTQLLQTSSFLSHSLRAALLSGACFAASALLAHRLPAEVVLPSLATSQAAAVTCALTATLALSGVPAFVDAILQVCYTTVAH